MSEYQLNVYYDTNEQPNSVGLVKVGDLDEDGLSYEYHKLLVVKHIPTGRVFYTTDSGCSCPTPFEDYHFYDADHTDLTEITVGDSFDSFQREVESFPATQREREDLLSAVKGLLK